MRLDCEVIVQNWSSTQGLVCRRKATRASISVGRKAARSSIKCHQNQEKDNVLLMLSTANDLSGSKYKVKENISNIFGKFVGDGKATIRFKQPSHELCISKADPKILYKFLTILMGTSSTEGKKVKLPVITSIKKADKLKTKQDLMLVGHSEYLKTKAAFPEGLVKLGLVNCSLIKFDVRILSLSNLVELNLSNNKLKELNFSLDHLRKLRNLNLSSNELQWIPSRFCLNIKLIALDLSHNKLVYLPVAFGCITSLVNLKLNNNNIVSLPYNTCELVNLRLLDVSNNNLTILPWTVASNLKLQKLDIAANKFLTHENFQITRNCLDYSLQDLAGKAIKRARLSYNPHMIGRLLCDFLDSAKICFKCRRWCISCIYGIGCTFLNDLAQEVISSGDRYVPIELYYCSQQCFNGKMHKIQMDWLR